MYLNIFNRHFTHISKTKDKRGADDDRSNRAEDRRVWVSSFTIRLDSAGDRSVLLADRIEIRGLDHNPNQYKELEKCHD